MSEVPIIESNDEINDNLPSIEETPKPKKNRYTNEEERHDAILKAKRDYYHRNNDLFKLKSRKRYYNIRLGLNTLSDESRTKYESKIHEIDEAIANFKTSEQ